MNRPIVDVAIVTYKPDNKFLHLVEKLEEQTYPIRRRIVINTEEEYFPQRDFKGKEHLEIHHIQKEAFDHGGTRDFACSLSDADIVVFFTQDAVPENDRVIEELIKPFQDNQVAVVYGRQLPTKECNKIERYTRQFNYPDKTIVKSKKDMETMGIKTFFSSNVCAAYRQDIYRKSGGFIKRAIFNEDMIYAAKVIKKGWKVVYAGKARVIHSHNYNSKQQFKRNFDLGVSQADHPEVFKGIKSESEGIRLVKNTARYLIKSGQPWLVFSLINKSAAKFLGYRMGKRYKKLSRKMILRCTMNPRYWGHVTL